MDHSQGGASETMNTFRRGKKGCLRSRAGFTLIELMVVVAIVTILAAIALPSYTRYVLKTRRTAAMACVSEYANYMERYYTTNLTYVGASTAPALDCQSTQQTGNYYTITGVIQSASAYTLTATPILSQAADSCGALGMDQKGTRTASDTTCW